jgi:hypothetical protein
LLFGLLQKDETASYIEMFIFPKMGMLITAFGIKKDIMLRQATAIRTPSLSLAKTPPVEVDENALSDFQRSLLQCLHLIAIDRISSPQNGQALVLLEARFGDAGFFINTFFF